MSELLSARGLREQAANGVVSAVAGPGSPLRFDRSNFSDNALIELYRSLLLPRMVEEKLLVLVRQGHVSKWFSGLGQEAIAVGATAALRRSDMIFPLQRNLGVFTTRGLPLDRLFGQLKGRATGFSKGRERSFHFGVPEYGVIGMISHLGAMLGVADGVALASNLDRHERVALAFSGDGGASQGDFHEAVNTAAVWGLPVIFLIENNGYALSTPSACQFRCAQLADRAAGYGIEGITIDGNNILEVHETIARVADAIRVDRRPVIVEAMTFRMRGHEEASGVAYVPPELIEQWGRRDPVAGFEAFLVEQGVLSAGMIAFIREGHRKAIDDAVEAMLQAPEPLAVPAGTTPAEAIRRELDDVYAPAANTTIEPTSDARRELRLVDAISDGLRQGMQRDPRLVIMGQDIADYGGVFKVTKGFVEEFGVERVRDTTLCESAIVGASLGLAIAGRPSVVEMQFSDFVTNAFNQIVNNLAKCHYRWGQQVNVTVRMPTGAGVGAGPFHSQSTEAWFAHVPGLKVVYPSNPYDAKGLITQSLLDPNPVMFYEHKLLYRGTRGIVPDDYYTLPFGVARLAREGTDLTIVTYGLGVHWALALSDQLRTLSIEVIDLRTLVPWDRETVFASARKTGRVLVLHEDTQTGGFGAELASVIGEACFDALDAPVARLGSLDTMVPFNVGLEAQFLAQARLRDTVERLMKR